MVTRKESTPEREARRRYEESHKEQRQAKNNNFQTMIPKELYDELATFLKERNMTKVEFIKQAYELLKSK